MEGNLTKHVKAQTCLWELSIIEISGNSKLRRGKSENWKYIKWVGREE